MSEQGFGKFPLIMKFHPPYQMTGPNEPCFGEYDSVIPVNASINSVTFPNWVV